MSELIIQLHRYLGIPVSAIVVMWFASGIVMMYTRGMPALGPGESLQLKSAIPVEQIRLAPAAALERNGFDASPQDFAVEALLLRPVYRFGGDLAIFADDGELFDGADEASGREIVATAFKMPTSRIVFAGALTEPDQWTITERQHLPLLRYELEDVDATVAYVSMTTGEIVLATDRRSRFLAWIGAIPHWIYFTTLRKNQPAWYWTVVALSVIGCLVAVMGLVLLFTQFRKSSPFNLGESIRYRGLMRWHYISGALFGLFALTWLFSGLLSMDPFRWQREAGLHVDDIELNGGPPDIQSIDLADFAALSAHAPFKRLEAVNVLGDVRWIVSRGNGEGRQVIDPAAPARSDSTVHIATLVDRLERVTGVDVIEAEMLAGYDSYYYDRERARPLPVLRAMFDDADETSAYVDPATGRIVGRTHRFARLDRWLFNGLHSLDFGSWYDNRPLWDVVVIVLSLGGLASSGIGFVLGFRRIRRWFGRLGLSMMVRVRRQDE